MSIYTVQLRQLSIDAGWTDEKIGLANYPIFDENYRTHLNSLIRDWYAFEEIGFETPARFAQRLDVKMRLIMPYYNQLYLATMDGFNPFQTVNVEHNSLTDFVGKILNSTASDKTSETASTSNGKINSAGVSDGTTNVDGTHTTKGAHTEIDKGTTDVNETRDFTDTEGGTVKHKGHTMRSGSQTTDINGSEKNIERGEEKNRDDGDVIRSGSQDLGHGLTTTTSYGRTETADNKHIESVPPNSIINASALGKIEYASSAYMEHNTNKLSGKDEVKNSGKDTTTYNNVTDRTNMTHTKSFTNRETEHQYLQRNDKLTYNDVKDEQDLTDTYDKTMTHTGTGGTKTTVDMRKTTTVDDGVKIQDKTSQNTTSSQSTGTADTSVSDILETILSAAKTNSKNVTTGKWTRKGFEGVSITQLLEDFYRALRNIDQMLLDDLGELFITLLN